MNVRRCQRIRVACPFSIRTFFLFFVSVDVRVYVSPAESFIRRDTPTDLFIVLNRRENDYSIDGDRAEYIYKYELLSWETKAQRLQTYCPLSV